MQINTRVAVIGGEKVSQTQHTDKNKHDTQNETGIEVTLDMAQSALIEQLLKHDTQLHKKATRKLNAVVVKEVPSMKAIRNVPKLLKIDDISATQIKTIIPKKGLPVEDKTGAQYHLSAGQILFKGHSVNGIKHTLEALCSIQERANIVGEEKVAKGLQIETPKTLDIIEEARSQFSISEDTPLHTVEIDANLLHNVRFSQDMTEDTQLGVQRCRGILVTQAGLGEGQAWRQTTALSINAETIQQLKIYYVGHYCSACSKATGKSVKTYSTEWVANGGCKMCHSKDDCHGTDPQIQLPFIGRTGEVGVKSGFVEFRVVKVPSKVAKLLVKVQKGYADVSQFIEALVNCQNLVMNGTDSNGKGYRAPARVEKTAFDVINSTVEKVWLGLSVHRKTTL